jgi:NitT/TauT family transport system substrate-binding protein
MMRATVLSRLAPGALAIALVTLAGCGDDAAPSPKAAGDSAASAKVRISYVPATTALPIHVAKQQGFFARNKIDATLTPAANISDIPATLGRQFDIALGTATDLIRASAAGVDVVQVAGNTVSTKDNPFVKVVVRPKSGIKTVTDLEGKQVGSPTLSGVIHAAVLYWDKKAGGDPSKIEGVEAPSPNLPDQLKAKRIDAVEALEPFASAMLAKGSVSIGDPFSQIQDRLATNFWISQGTWARENQDVVARFTTALEQARAFIAESPVPARKILQEYTKMPPPIAAKVPLPTYDFGIRTDDLATWETVLKDIGQFKGDVDPNKLVLSSGE